MHLIHGFSARHIKGDIFGGITTAVVALPLALAFGVASGAGAIAGLYGAIFVGFFAALFGGTPAQASGPTGPMTVVMAGIILEFAGNPALAFTVVILGGALQITFGAMKLGRYVTYVPFPVISGFMSGIGCIIIILQLAPLFGHPGSAEGVFAALAALPAVVTDAKVDALLVGTLALAIMLFFPNAWRKWAPPPLVALIVGTLVALLLFPEVPVIGEIPRGLPTPSWPEVELAALPAMLRLAIILAVLGTIDSLLTSLVADQVTRSHHDSNRELVGQGIGNMVAGLMGAIPGAGATMRTVVNVRAGGRTPISGALHALILLALILGLAPLAEAIPLAVLAGILLKVGWDIIDWKYMRRLRRARRTGVIVMFTVLLLTVLVDLMTAVGVGIIMISLISASRLSEHQLAQIRVVSSETEDPALSDTEKALMKETAGRILLFHLSGAFSFASANEMGRRLSAIGVGYRAVVFDFSEVPMVDTSVGAAVEELVALALDNDQLVFIAGLASAGLRDLERMHVLDRVPKDQRFETRLEALRAAAGEPAA